MEMFVEGLRQKLGEIGPLPSHSWVASHLLEAVSQYPGGLSEAVILTSLSSRQPKNHTQASASKEAGLTLLSHHNAGKATLTSVSRANISDVVCISQPGSNAGPSSHRGGVWLISLEDGSTRDPLLMYAHSSLTSVLAACTHPSVTSEAVGPTGPTSGETKRGCIKSAPSLRGCIVRLAGPIRQPHRVVLGGNGGATQLGRYLPTRALILELDASDPAWLVSEDLSTHPILGSSVFGRVCSLSGVAKVLATITSHDQGLIDGWLSATVSSTSKPVHTSTSSRQSVIYIKRPMLGDEASWNADSPVVDKACSDISETPFVLYGEAAALSYALHPGERLLIHCPAISHGAFGRGSLEMGPETLIVVRGADRSSKGTAVPLSVKGGISPIMDVDTQSDQQVKVPQNSMFVSKPANVAAAPVTEITSKCLVDNDLLRLGELLLMGQSQNQGSALWARVVKILRCCRQASSRCWILHLLLEDTATGSQMQALLELTNNSRVIHQMYEGHTLLLIGVKVSDLSASASWASEALRSWVRQHGGQGCGGGQQPLLLWREADDGSKLFNISCIPGVLNSPSLNHCVTLKSAMAPEPRRQGTNDSSRSLSVAHCSYCIVDIAGTVIHTHRVHRFCGRPVTAFSFDTMMTDDDESGDMDGQEKQGMCPPIAAADPTTISNASGLAIEDIVAETTPPLTGVLLSSPGTNMSLDGLWECAFCGIECSTSEVAWGVSGEVTVRQYNQAAAAAGDSDASVEGTNHQDVAVLKADPAALRALMRTSAEDWRQRGLAGAHTSCDKGWMMDCCPHLASVYWTVGDDACAHLALIHPLGGRDIASPVFED